NTISSASVGARPHRNDDSVKPTTDSISSRLRPNMLASQPVIGRMIAFATRYEVSTHVASSIVTDKLPAMCGSDTLTTVVSSTSMKVANITDTAMSQGLMGRSVNSQLSTLNSQLSTFNAQRSTRLSLNSQLFQPFAHSQVSRPLRRNLRLET